MATLKLSLALLFVAIKASCQMISPCPRLFTYEPQNPNEPDRWYGQLILQSDSELQGVWLRVVFDKPSIQLGNWFGEVERREQSEYLIKNPRQKLFPNQPMTVRFFVRFKPGETPPQLTGFRLNAKTVCPEGSSTTVPPLTQNQLFTNSDSGPTTPSSGSNWNGGGGGGNWNGGNGGGGTGGGGNWNGGGNIGGGDFNRPDAGDEVFPGDFTLINRPGTTLLDTTCGIVIEQPKPLITHGQVTHEAEFPWHVALYHAAGIDLTYICGASLISKIHILTVAHCVTRRGRKQTLNPDSLVVYLGKYYLRKWSNPGIQDRHVAQITPHPNYNSQTYSDDIAVLKLTDPVEITNFVRPVCLWAGDNSLQGVVNKVGTVVGWGYNESGIVTDQLMKAGMPIVSQETCIYSFPDFFSRFTNSKTFCAGYKNGTSVCNGDSGGGLVLPQGTGKGTVWHIRGLVSISVALQNTFKCDANHYVVFTDVAKYIDWIRSLLK
ncbi:clotting factor C isoform X2 [Aethina tumida]|uniref:clotting factor C isoform X2 n=1 Tax=Aethina tumida TaxID=116153 RepID=UPI0021472756|nr:clotting factor C isoform X2 [Aethina tumida]